MDYKLNDKTLVLSFAGELNSYNSANIEKEIEEICKANSFEKIVLDFAKIIYVSSAGLRIVLKLKQKYKNISVINVSLEVYDVFQMTGFTNIMEVKKAIKEIYIDGAEVIGTGYFSTVYRVDKDTIVKVFNITSDPDQIERELRLAKEAFVLGIPTAISFDIVKVKDKLGVRFEMLDCSSLKEAVINHPDRIHEYLVKYANLLKTINTTECFNPEIPVIKEKYVEAVEIIKDYLDKDHYLKAKKLVAGIEERHTFVHGDCHFKNIMVQNDEFILIDMDTLSVGHPIFELAQIYAPYCAFSEDDPGNSERFFEVKDEDARRLFFALMNEYFGRKVEDDIINKIRLVCYIHMVWWTINVQPENSVRLNGCRDRLIKLLDEYNDLDIGL